MKQMKPLACIILISAMFIPLLITDAEVLAVPDDHPITLNGGYLTELEGTLKYVDHLQPGDTESYNVHLENDNEYEVQYQLTVSNIPADWTVFLENGLTTMNINMPGSSSGEVSKKDFYMYLKNPTVGTGTIDIAIRDRSTDERWKVVLEVVCEVGPVDISLPVSQMTVGQNTPYTGSFTLENIGTDLFNISLKMDKIIPAEERIEGEWTVIFSQNHFLLAGGSKKTIDIIIWAPSNSLIGDKKISHITAMAEGINRPFTTQDIDITVANIFDLRAVVLPLGHQKVKVGEQAEFNLTLENWATTTDNVRVWEESLPTGWGVFFNDQFDPTTTDLPISPGSSRTFHPVVTIPINALAGRDKVVLIAEGNANRTIIELPIEVERRDDFLATLSSEVLGGKGGIYGLTLGDNLLKFNLQNRGNSLDTVTISIDQSPSWGDVSFHSLTVGPGSAGFESNGGNVNLSNDQNLKVEFVKDGLRSLELTFSPYQTAVVTLMFNVPMDAPARNGVISIIYSFGVFDKQQYFQMGVKLNLLDLEIVDRDGDGTADLDLYPSPDYTVGDRIHFFFSIKNNYPFSPRDVTWKILFLETIILEGEVGEIAPGETKEFNVSWKIDRSTKAATAYLRLESPSYPAGSSTPSAISKQEFSIESAENNIPWGFIILVAGLGLSFIAIFSYLYFNAQERKRIREEGERKEYDMLYGPTRRPGLKGRTSEDTGTQGPSRKKLEGGKRKPSLPAMGHNMGPPRKGEHDIKAKKGKKDDKKTAPGLKKVRPPGKRSIEKKSKDRRKDDNEDDEELPEFEEL